MDRAGLHIENLLALGSDGPNVCKAVFKKMNKKVLEVKNKGLAPIGTCSIHIIHNSFLKALHSFGSDVNDLVIEVYHFFHGWPGRCEDFEKMQKQNKVPPHRFLKHSTTRWLTLVPAAERLLEQLPALKEYFLDYIPNVARDSRVKRSQQYRFIRKMLENPTLQASILFVVTSSKHFMEFTEKFQSEAPLIHTLGKDLRDIVVRLVGRTCKAEVLAELDVSQTIGSDLLEEQNLIPPADIILAQPIIDALAEVSSDDVVRFRKGVLKHFVAATKYVIKMAPIDNPFIMSLSCFSPDEIWLPSSVAKIGSVCQELPLANIDASIVADEWRLLQLKVENRGDVSGQRIDIFWEKLLSSLPRQLSHLPKVVRTVFSLPHGSANIEREFSKSGRQLSQERASMSEKTLNSRLTVLDGIKEYGGNAHSVPVTQDLLKKAQNARRAYILHLEAEKKKKQDTDEAKELDEEHLKKVEENRETLTKLENDTKKFKESIGSDGKVYEGLVQEAQQRLNQALEKNDIIGCKVAQSILQSADASRARESEKRKAYEVMEKKRSEFLKLAFTKRK